MWEEREAIYRLIVVERGHFYVCGDCTMAEDVYQTLRKIIQDRSGLGESEADNFVLSLRVRTFLIVQEQSIWSIFK